jgi:hypothetical protein
LISFFAGGVCRFDCLPEDPQGVACLLLGFHEFPPCRMFRQLFLSRSHLERQVVLNKRVDVNRITF